MSSTKLKLLTQTFLIKRDILTNLTSSWVTKVKRLVFSCFLKPPQQETRIKQTVGINSAWEFLRKHKDSKQLQLQLIRLSTMILKPCPFRLILISNSNRSLTQLSNHLHNKDKLILPLWVISEEDSWVKLQISLKSWILPNKLRRWMRWYSDFINS